MRIVSPDRIATNAQVPTAILSPKNVTPASAAFLLLTDKEYMGRSNHGIPLGARTRVSVNASKRRSHHSYPWAFHRLADAARIYRVAQSPRLQLASDVLFWAARIGNTRKSWIGIRSSDISPRT
jgi:hypothetical protein